MKKLIALCSFISATFLSTAQQDPVAWEARYVSSSPSEGEIVITGKIEKGWHIYSQRPTDAGPIPTSFTLMPSTGFTLVDQPIEEGAQEEFDKAFGAKIYVFNQRAVLKQKIKLNGKPGFPIHVQLEFMSCNDMMCLPPKIIELTVKTQ
jgi:thiol:disulfide interchange protein DsbD